LDFVHPHSSTVRVPQREKNYVPAGEKRWRNAASHLLRRTIERDMALRLPPRNLYDLTRNIALGALALGKKKFDRKLLAIVNSQAKHIMAFGARLIQTGGRVHSPAMQNENLLFWHGVRSAS
jgi:hypothetical protein